MAFFNDRRVLLNPTFPVATAIVGLPTLAAGVNNNATLIAEQTLLSSPTGTGFANTHRHFIGGQNYAPEIGNIIVNAYGMTLNQLKGQIAHQMSRFNSVCLWVGFDDNGWVNQIVPMRVPHFRYAKSNINETIPDLAAIWDNWAGENSAGRITNYWGNISVFSLYDGATPSLASISIEANNAQQGLPITGAGGYVSYQKVGVGQILFAANEIDSNDFYPLPKYYPVLEGLAAERWQLARMRSQFQNKAGGTVVVTGVGAVSDEVAEKTMASLVNATNAEQGTGFLYLRNSEAVKIDMLPYSTGGGQASEMKAFQEMLREQLMILYGMPATVARVQTSGKLGDSGGDDRILGYMEYNIVTEQDRYKIGGILNELAKNSSILPTDFDYSPRPNVAPTITETPILQ